MIAYALLLIITFMAGVVCLVVQERKSTSFYRVQNSTTKIHDKQELTQTIITTFFVGYLFLLCFRDTTIGNDTDNYIKLYFRPFSYMSLKQIIAYRSDEIGFSLLVKLIATITSNKHIFVAIISLLSVIPIMLLYRNEAKSAAIACSFFLISLLFEFFFSGMRQGIAIALTVPAFYFVKKKKPLWFLLIVLLAMSMHSSAIMIIFMYPVYYARVNRKTLWIAVPAMLAIYWYRMPIFNYLYNAFGGKYFEKYSILTGNSNQYGLMMLFILLAIYGIIMMDERKAGPEDFGLRNLLLLSTVIQCFAPIHDIVSRMNYYYILFIPLAIGRVNACCRRQLYRISKIATLVMTVFFVFYFFFIKGDTLHIMNYKFFF